MRVDAAPGCDAQAAHQFDFAVGGEIERGARIAQGAHHGRMRQALDGVKELDAGECRRQAPELRAHPVRIDEEEGRPVAPDQVLDGIARERVSRRIELR